MINDVLNSSGDMYKIGKYAEGDSMSNLICDNYQMLLVMSRFGISLGFGDMLIGEVCQKNGVDTNTFIAVVNRLVNEEDCQQSIDVSNISISSLIMYLRTSHKYFIDFRLPLIRQKLINALGSTNNDINLVIIKYYDEYVKEVYKHMMYEEKKVFTYVEELMNDTLSNGYNITIFCKRHDNVESKLSELKDIIIKYYPGSSSNELNSVLFDIFSCAKDLSSHNDIENSLFIPAIQTLEQNKKR